MTEQIAVSLSALQVDDNHRNDVMMKLVAAATPLMQAGHSITIEAIPFDGLTDLNLMCTPDDLNDVRWVMDQLTSPQANLAVLGHTVQLELMPFTNTELVEALRGDDTGVVDFRSTNH
ncbi:hypothetical protein CH274_13270 [Rhodococcus sp. 06-418-5]|uniref:hypothetical protein n=1 Tax=Rhodococcus sp. 06-418-5 TaxID=2022507 RepID=UPI000B9A5BBC|nr:hypothetical protein [Rhodococcus sp. 06-418-5]OZC80199.1 hypothetical protein CH274_13270 [Rhodococcus sp. 06-418-5]